MMPRLKAVGIAMIGPVVFLGLYAIYAAQTTSFYFPTLGEILKAFKETWLHDGMQDNVIPSLRRLAIGYLIAVVVAVAVGLIIGLNRRISDACEPVLHFLRALPPPALIPIGMLALGLGDSMKIATIALGAVWPILLNTVDGARATETALIDTARTYHIPRWSQVRHIVLPAAAPQIFAGMRISLAIGIALMVTSEMLASSDGIGYAILEAQRTFAIPEMWSGILLLGVIGYVATALFSWTERRALRWHAGVRRLESSI